MKLNGLTVGVGITGSFCTFEKILVEIQNIVNAGAKVVPILSFNSQNIDTRFFKAEDFVKKLKEITNCEPIITIEGAEPIGPKKYLDILLIAPCTGNTLAKINCGITDTPVLMATKAHIRNEKPVVIMISTNDALGNNLKNIGSLITMKNIYFVPFGQDNFKAKPKSMVAIPELIVETLEYALEEKQIQPIIVAPV